MAAYFRKLSPEIRQRQEDAWNGTKRKETLALTPRPPLPKARTFQGGQHQGHQAEERFLRICEAALRDGKFPPWIEQVVRGTYAEDSMGIDMVALAGEHRIPIQIKSSFVGLRKFRRRSDRQHIICIVVATTLSDEDILSETLESITLAWEERS